MSNGSITRSICDKYGIPLLRQALDRRPLPWRAYARNRVTRARSVGDLYLWQIDRGNGTPLLRQICHQTALVCISWSGRLTGPKPTFS